MSHQITENIKKTRMARKAQLDSGLSHDIKLLQKQIVIHSFAKNFDVAKHKELMNRLKELKAEYKNIGTLQFI